jgi:hypothetical protein
MGEVNKEMTETVEGKAKTATEGADNALNKPSYEQLKNWCDQLLMQRNQIAEELRQVSNIVNKLPWLFKVIENKEVFSTEFVNNCVKEIVDIMTPPEEEKEEKEDK